MMRRSHRLLPFLLLLSAVFLLPRASDACQYCDRDIICVFDPIINCWWETSCFGVEQPPHPRSAQFCNVVGSNCMLTGAACTWASHVLPEWLRELEPATTPAPDRVLVCSLSSIPIPRS